MNEFTQSLSYEKGARCGGNLISD